MWSDWENPAIAAAAPYNAAKPYLRFDDGLWNDLLQRMSQTGFNMVVLDLGDGVRWESHPEIAVENAWTVERLREELAKMRSLGLEPIPKLNFSTCHDQWMGPYARRISTPEYYAFCHDLIAEVIALFDTPRFFHLGMDEEELKHQRHFEYVVLRQGDLWWRDFRLFVDQVESAGIKPWIWSDYVWEHPDLFWERMPRSVLQSNWYYGTDFGPNVREPRAYRELEQHGFDQIPTVSIYKSPENVAKTVQFCRDHIAPERLKGFLLAPWKPTLEACRAHHLQAVETMGNVIRSTAEGSST